jgi:hypothetical protein
LFIYSGNKIRQVADSSRYFVIDTELIRSSVGFGFLYKQDQCLFKENLLKIFDAERKLQKEKG